MESVRNFFGCKTETKDKPPLWMKSLTILPIETHVEQFKKELNISDNAMAKMTIKGYTEHMGVITIPKAGIEIKFFPPLDLNKIEAPTCDLYIYDRTPESGYKFGICNGEMPTVNSEGQAKMKIFEMYPATSFALQNV
jgi:hypothetical protein